MKPFNIALWQITSFRSRCRICHPSAHELRTGVRHALPGGILADLVRPLITPFVVDLPLREEPLAVNLHQFVFVVSEAVEDAAAFRIVVGVVEPIRTARRLVALDPDDDVRNVVAGGSRAESCRGRRVRHACDHVLDGLTAGNNAAAVVEYSVLGERGDVEVRIVKVEREKGIAPADPLSRPDPLHSY
jgi:hypothetical protein